MQIDDGAPHLWALLATGAALASGPLLHHLAGRRPRASLWLDRGMMVAIAALLLLEAIPESVRQGGLASLAFVLLGALGPNLLEHALAPLRRATHVLTLLVALGGLILHSVADGAALAPGGAGHDHGLGLAAAVALHSVPVSLTVWLLLQPPFGSRRAAMALLLMATGTLLGYLGAAPLAGWLGEQGWAWLQGLVAGSILHVVFGRPHLHDHGRPDTHRHDHPH